MTKNNNKHNDNEYEYEAQVLARQHQTVEHSLQSLLTQNLSLQCISI